MALWLDLGRYALVILSVLAAGTGVLWLLGSWERTLHVGELIGLVLLLGGGTVTVAWLVVGLVLPVLAPWLVIALCLGLLAVGLVRRRSHGALVTWSHAGGRLDLMLALALGLQFALVVALAVYGTTLGWDGLFNWEIKARVVCLNGGAMPLGDALPTWAHPRYPPFIPLLEAWLYHWLGRCDQGAAKLIFPVFYGIAVGLLCAGMARLGVAGPVRLLPALLLFFVPLAIVGDGSASSGYADFPLAVVYLAAVLYLVEYLQTRAAAALIVAALMTALLAWIKLDGVIPALCLTAVVVAVAIRERRPNPALLVGLPAVLVFVGWAALVNRVELPPETEFLPVTVDTLRLNALRLLDIVPWIGREMLYLTRWGLFWPVAMLATLYLLRSHRHRINGAIVAAWLTPLLAYSCLFIFSAWSPFLDHVDSSLPRLMLHGVLVAMLLVGLAIARVRDAARS